jgi:hypothetical protein
MEAEEKSTRRRLFRKRMFTVAKAAIKTAIVCLIYVIVSQLLAPVSSFIPGLQQMLQNFIVVYVILMVISDLTSGTVFQYIFSASRSGFVIAYLIVSLNSGIFSYTFGNLSLMVDLRVILIVVMLLELLGLARSVIQEIDFVSQKAELEHI